MKYEKKISVLNLNFTEYVRLIQRRSLLQLGNKAVKISKSSITVINFNTLNKSIFYWMAIRTKRMHASMETAQAL